MKRTTPLKRRVHLRSRPTPVDHTNPDRIAWKVARAGYCACGCQRFSMHLENHHVIALEVIKREGREDLAWDPRNSMLLHPLCHARHTNAVRRIPDRAALYIARFYGCSQRWAA